MILKSFLVEKDLSIIDKYFITLFYIKAYVRNDMTLFTQFGSISKIVM